MIDITEQLFNILEVRAEIGNNLAKNLISTKLFEKKIKTKLEQTGANYTKLLAKAEKSPASILIGDLIAAFDIESETIVYVRVLEASEQSVKFTTYATTMEAAADALIQAKEASTLTTSEYKERFTSYFIKDRLIKDVDKLEADINKLNKELSKLIQKQEPKEEKTSAIVKIDKKAAKKAAKERQLIERQKIRESNSKTDSGTTFAKIFVGICLLPVGMSIVMGIFALILDVLGIGWGW